jgi:two-component system, OmpR family, response regulator
MLVVGVCEDDPGIRAVLVRGLRQAGHEVVAAHDGREALSRLGADQPLDVVVMDIGLPDADGRDVVLALRSAGQHAPVLFLTALGGTHEVLAGFAAGADDYVVKPFELRELLARIRTVLRRAAASSVITAPVRREVGPAPDRVRLGRLELDLPARRLLEPDGKEVPLTSMEFDLLNVLLRNPNRVLSRDQLLAQAHNDSWEPFDRSIDIRIARLRKKVERDPANPEAIRTVRGVGYMFVPENRG